MIKHSDGDNMTPGYLLALVLFCVGMVILGFWLDYKWTEWKLMMIGK